jgi:hypothetical protein
MTNQTERAFVSDSESWNVFVGGVTVKEFLQGEEPSVAVENYLQSFPFNNEPIPSWLRRSLLKYIESDRADEAESLTQQWVGKREEFVHYHSVSEFVFYGEYT